MIKNVILITIDALRWDYLGYNNPGLAKKKISPNLDRLAKKSVLFDQAISQGPYTKAAFPAIFYAQYPSKITEQIKGRIGWGRIKKNTRSWVEKLREAGFLTAGFTTNPLTGRFLNYGQGFQEFKDRDRPFSFLIDKVWPKLDQKLKALFIDRIKKNVVSGASMDSPYINQMAGQWLEKIEDQKFFLWLHYMDVHEPYWGNFKPSHLSEKEKQETVKIREAYQKGVKFADRSLGELLEFLEKQKFLDNTLLIITADHGECLGEHGILSHPGQFSQSLIRVPLLFYSEGLRPKREKRLVGLIDIGPTILDLFNLRPLAKSQGQSFKPYLRGENEMIVREAIVIESFSSKGSPKKGYPANYSLRTDCFQLNVYLTRKENPIKELYDLKVDPMGKDNLIRQRPEIAKRLEERFKEEYFNE